MAVKVGFAVGFAVSKHNPDAVNLTFQLIHVTVIPFFYHAFIHMGLELAHPLGCDYMSLPGYSYHCYIRNENVGFIAAGEAIPKELVDDIAPERSAPSSPSSPFLIDEEEATFTAS